jgi:hypothetical protein
MTKKFVPQFLGAGIAIGVALGVAMHNIGAGIGIGVILGLAISFGVGKARERAARKDSEPRDGRTPGAP